MSNLAPGEAPKDRMAAYPLTARYADMVKFIERQWNMGLLGKVKPGFVAGTYGLTKAEVQTEIRKHNELMGGK